MKEAGVARWPAVVKSLRQFEATPEIAMAIIKHHRDNAPAWDAGALHNKCVLWRPGQKITDNWPRIPAKTESDVERQQRLAATAKQQAEFSTERTESDGERDRQQTLEQTWGPVIDALNAADSLGLEVATIPNEEVRGKTPPKMKRALMAAYMDDQHNNPPEASHVNANAEKTTEAVGTSKKRKGR